MAWAIDLGTCNTAVGRWNEDLGRPELVALPAVCRDQAGHDPLGAPLLVPSATEIVVDVDAWTRLSRHRWLAGRVAWGREAYIGRAALERNPGTPKPAFVRSFKPWLGRASTTPIGRAGDRPITARDAARAWLRELLAEIRRTTGERPRDLVLTTPVEAFEAYRAELAAIASQLGVRRTRFVDEPVAAALGYGLGLTSSRRVLVVDFGAGTLDLALVELSARDVERGRTEVLAKAGRSIGGDHVDQWLADALCARVGASAPGPDDFWRPQLVDEARRIKEGTYVRGHESFVLATPWGGRRDTAEVRVDQDLIEDVLRQHGLFDVLEQVLDDVLGATDPGEVHDVLLVGGSTLLPGVHAFFASRFGRARVRGWQPFEAVVWGATAYAAGAVTPIDRLVHDYAIVMHDPGTSERRLVPIVARGTSLPTRPDHWRQQLVPTCPLGEPETLFKLVVCEVGADTVDERLIGRDALGRVQLGGAGQPRLVVPLNEASPTLGLIEPPHAPGDRTPRLDVAFGVDDGRWLITTVTDLKTGKTLLRDRPVVRLL